jgi:hypothetical protein
MLNATGLQLLIGVAALAVIGIIVLALFNRADDALPEIAKLIITGALGGGAGAAGVNAIHDAQAKKKADSARDAWRNHGVD